MWQVINEDSPTGGEEEGGAGWRASKRGRSQTRTHQLEGRKKEEWVGELRNVACHKRGLTNWRGGRGKSRLVSFEMWHVASEDSLEGRKREERVGELRNVARCKQGLTDRRGGRGRSPFVSLETWHVTEGSLTGGQEREELVGELGNMAHCKQGITC